MILKFSNEGARRKFVDLVERERPAIRSALEESRVLPHLVVSGLSRADADWIKTHVASLGRAFEDRKYDLFRV